MLEIVIIWRLAVHIGNAAKRKGFKKLGYQVMAVLLWICGEIFGGILGSVIFGTDSSFWLRYVTALLGAVAGAGIAFLIMSRLPNQESLSNSSEAEKVQEPSLAERFGRSGWVPVIVSLLAISCLCAGFGTAFIFQMRSMVQQIHATNPIIGTELKSDGKISQSIKEISSDVEIIYLSFYFDIPGNGKIPINYVWYIDGQPVYSFTDDLSKGQIVTALDRKDLGLSEFSKGSYEVFVLLGEKILTSASFNVK